MTTRLIDHIDAEEMYDEHLNSIYPETKIGIGTFYPSDILKNCDAIMYREGFHDYIDYLTELGIYVEGYNEEEMPK